MIAIKLFGFALAAGIALTSLAMMVWGERWHKAEVAAYGGERRPWWFYALSALIVGFYLLALAGFLGGEKSWAGWVLMVFIPIAWLLKSILLIFNPKGRTKVIALSEGSDWTKIGLARLPLALILAMLAALA
ncbi:MAG TPA: hypothetical protein G4N94_09550 [Caldilineae bacterium]|nr:hypothetical protein [Caldilineae bacterium]